MTKILTVQDLRDLAVGSAVLTSGCIVWVKYAAHETDDARFEWGRCDRTGSKFRDSAWLTQTSPTPLYHHGVPSALDRVEALCARWQRDAEMVNPTTGYSSDDVRFACARAIRAAVEGP